MNANKLIAIAFSILYLAAVVVIFVFFDAGHMRGLATMLAFALAAVSIVILWLAYGFVRRKNFRQSWLFALFALVLPGLIFGVTSGALLGAMKYRKHALSSHMAKVVVSNVHDELLLSKQGNPIGIRLKYSMTFPRGPAINVYDGPHSAVVLREPFVSTSRINQDYIQPPIPKYRYESDTTYIFSEDLVPDFIRMQLEYLGTTPYPATTFCLNSSYYERRLAADADRPYRFIVIFHNTNSPEIQTENAYNLKTLYDGAVRDGIKPCPRLQ